MMKISRIISAALAALFLLAPLAALAETAYVTSRTAVYAQPDESSRSVSVPAGTKLEFVKAQGGWAMVKKGSAVGYMDASKLATVVNQNGKAVYAKDGLKLYKSPSESGATKSVPAGAQLSLIATCGEWACVQSGSAKGFTKSSNLTAAAPPAMATPTPAPIKTVPGYARRDGVKVYESYSTGSAALATLARNDRVDVSSVKGNWCQVVSGSSVGYVPKADLATAPVAEAPTAAPTPASTNTPEPTKTPEPTAAPTKTPAPVKTVPGYVARDGAKVYKSFSTSSEVLATLSVNDQVGVSAVKGDWCQVVRGEAVAYMLKRDLSTKPVEAKAESYAAYVKTAGAKVYQLFSKTSTVLAELPVNFEVTVLAANGDWAQVQSGAKVGYMLLSDLSKTKVEVQPTPTPVPTATPVPEAVPAFVKSEGAKVYASPNASANVLATLSVNDQVGVRAVQDGWAQVVNASAVGYMLASDLSASKVEVVAVPAFIKSEGAKVYESPSTSASVLATLSINAEVSVTGANGDWCRVQNGSAVGYMLASDLSQTKIEVKDVALKYGDTGEAVKKVQSRLKELGFFAGTIGGNYMALTQSAVAAFQAAAKLTATGVADAQTLDVLFSDSAPKNTSTSSGSGEQHVDNAGYSTATPAKGTAIEKDWWASDIQKIFARGVTATVTDVSTGIAWREIRSGGTNHADCQPVTAADSNSMKKAAGSWSWTRRAIFVTINGVNYAASMNCMPHGSGSIKNNNFDGHHCIHFTNSRTHGGNRVCPLHQAAIKKALNASL